MRQKKLIRKIRRLEARQKKGATKLANLKEKLKAVEAAKLAKAKSKARARPRKLRTLFGIPLPVPEEKILIEPASKSEGTGRGRSFKKVKQKRHVTSERRAQLSAAMKARWAAKRAAAAATPEPNS